MDQLKIGELTLTWLHGGNNHIDGGAMFGVVPKSMWSKKYAANANNLIEMRADPILIQTGSNNLIIDSGMGMEKLTAKQLKIYGVTDSSKLLSSLNNLGLGREDIDYLLLTHMHADHAAGLTMLEEEKWVATFPHAQHIVTDVEWNEVREPNIRSRHTYWQENWQAIRELVVPFSAAIEVCQGVSMVHTGGHSAGHALICLESAGEQAFHLGDLLPTVAHQNPLWVPAYDDYPMDSIYAKQKWLHKAIQQGSWLTFYHDARYRAVKWDETGEIITSVKVGPHE